MEHHFDKKRGNLLHLEEALFLKSIGSDKISGFSCCPSMRNRQKVTSAAEAENLIQLTAGIKVFSFMTSFTQCSETSFTLPPERSEGGSKSALSKEGKDGLGNERYW